MKQKSRSFTWGRLVCIASMQFCVVVCALCAPGWSQVTDLDAIEDGDDVILSWSTGLGPFRVYRSNSPDFYFDNEVIATGLLVSTVVDPNGAVGSNQSSFYGSLDDSQLTPPGVFANPPPQAPPEIASLTPNSGPPGTMVTIAGTGFVVDGSRLTVPFHHSLARIESSSATSLVVEVPDGAFSGDVRVCIASDRCSNALPFYVTFGPLFQDLSSIAFEVGTGSLWVADRGTADELLEIDSTGLVTVRSTLVAQPIVGHPSPSDGSGRIFFSNSFDSIGNQGPIRVVNSASNVDSQFDNAGGGAGDWVRCEGIAGRDSQPTTAYFLDGVDNTVRRVFSGPPTHDNNYGNTNLLNFNRPAGARFDSAGNLYVTSTNAIYRITPDEVVTAVGSGFTAAAGMDLFETGTGPILIVADESTGEIYFVDPSTATRSRMYSGLAAPVGVALAASTGAVGTALYVAEPTRILKLPDPRLSFEVQTDQKVLLTMAVETDTPPSVDQRAELGAGSIELRVRLHPFLNPTGLTAYFRLVDPPDPSPYITGAAEGDNLPSPGGTLTAQAAFASNRIARAILTVAPNTSGNNFRVEASLSGGADFRPLAESPNYTSWRRVYIEHDHMFKQGEWINGDSGADQQFPNRVMVANSAIFSVDDEVYVISGDSPGSVVGEYAVVLEVEATYLVLDRNLLQNYPGISTPDTEPFSFVGRIDGLAYGDVGSFATLRDAYDDAFAEFRVLQNEGFVPRWSAPGLATAGAYIDARDPFFFDTLLDPGHAPITNTLHLVSAESSIGLLGLTRSEVGFPNWVWTFESNIKAEYPGPGGTVLVEAVEAIRAHELGHAYDVNQDGPLGHDTEPAWLPGGTKCLMHADPDAELGVVKLHRPASTNDLMCIRTHVDALDVNSVCFYE